MIAKFKKTSRTRGAGAMLLLVALACIVLTNAYVAKADFEFGAPVNLGPAINSPLNDCAACISADGLSLLFTRWANSSGPFETWLSTRTTRDTAWADPVNLGPWTDSLFNELPGNVLSFQTADGLENYSDNGSDLCVRKRETTTKPWGPEENVGPVPVVVRFENGRPVFARFTTAVLPEHRPSPHGIDELAAMIGLERDEIGGAGPSGSTLEPEMVSCGLEYFVIPVRTVDAVRRAVLDTSRWQRMLADAWAHHVYLVCMDGEGPDVDVRVRMWAPGSGVPEDPATGSAAAALGGYLSKAEGSAEATLAWTVEQGIEIGRPSLLYVEADRAGGTTSAVRVGGSAVPVSRGTMHVPDGA